MKNVKTHHLKKLLDNDDLVGFFGWIRIIQNNGTVFFQVVNLFPTDAGNPEFNLEIDEVFLTDLENAPVSTHHMRPGNFCDILPKMALVT